MAAARWEQLLQRLAPLLGDLLAAPAARRRAQIVPPLPGLYLFGDDSNPIYVGQTRNLRRRLADHCRPSSDHFKASLAFLIARDELNAKKVLLPSGVRLHYQQVGCDKLVDDEISQLLTLAGANDTRPAEYTLPSADDLKKVGDDTANFMAWLQEGGAHGKMMWMATCGSEYPDVTVRIMELKPADGDNVTLEVYRPSATDADAMAKEMDAATAPNMEVHVVGQPEAKRFQKDDYARFTGTLSGYQPAPMFLLTWDMAKINMEDIPPDKPAAGAAKRPAHKLPGAK